MNINCDNAYMERLVIAANEFGGIPPGDVGILVKEIRNLRAEADSAGKFWKQAYEQKADELDRLRFPLLERTPGKSGVRPLPPAEPVLSRAEKALMIGIALGFAAGLALGATLRGVL